MSGELILDVRDLTRHFGDVKAVDGVAFRIDPGETYGLLGPNGSGKTTTISMICGLLEPDSGTVVVAGQPMTVTSLEPRRHIGLVPQDLATYPDLTARENLQFFGRLYGLSGAALAERVKEILEVIGLADRAGDRSGIYSGGMKRRLNIGIGLIHRPTLLILDEPTVGVDPQSRNAILESIEGLSRAGMAVLYTTHYMEEAERLCDRVGIIDGGKIRAEGTQAELVRLVGENDRIRLTGTGEIEAAAGRVRALGIGEASPMPEGVSVLTSDAGRHLTDILREATAAGMSVSSVVVEKPNLETVFLHLTGKALRD